MNISQLVRVNATCHRYLNILNIARSFSSNPPSENNPSKQPPNTSPQRISDVPPQIILKNPIVAQLWKARHEAKQRLSLTDATQQGGTSDTTDLTKAAAALIHKGKSTQKHSKGKTPSESETTVEYPFESDEFLRETYVNPWGTMRFGKVLEDLDALAGNIAFNHVDGNPLIVTAGVDRIRIRHQPTVEEDQILTGKVTWIGRSSMEICMRMISKNKNNLEDNVCHDINEREWLEAYFTFVTLDPDTKKPIPMTPLLPETLEERAHFELGALRAKNKKIARKNQLRPGQQLTETAQKIDQKAAELLEGAGTLLRMPSLADPNTILMDQTEQSNAMIAQPQVRNLHDRIFGGFLARRAYELAFSTCYLFGGVIPRFLEVDDISFEQPVDVGDLLVFKSRVLYTHPNGADLGCYVKDHDGLPLVAVEVECWKTKPEKGEAKCSNHFYFTFALPGKESCRSVLPDSLDQARRMASRMAINEEQAGLRS